MRQSFSFVDGAPRAAAHALIACALVSSTLASPLRGDSDPFLAALQRGSGTVTVPAPRPPAATEAIPVAAAEPLPLPNATIPAAPATCELALGDFEEMALANNPTLAIAWARINAARGRMVQSGLPPNPTIGYTGQNIGEEGTAGDQGGFIGQQFVTGKKLELNRAMGSREVLAERRMFQAQELRVLSDVRMRYYGALVAQRRVELTGELVRISGQLADSSRRLLEGDQASESDLLQAEIEFEESEIAASNARAERDGAWRQLTAVVGVPALELATLCGELDKDLPLYDWDQAYAQVLACHPEVQAAVARVDAARIAVTRARRENIPNVDVMAMAMHMNATGDDVAQIQAGIPIPVLNQNQGAVMQASAELVAAQNNVERIELDLTQRLAVAFRQYAAARGQVERYQQNILPRAQKAIVLVSTGYREGQVDFLTLLTSQRTFIRVSLAYLDSLNELRQSAALIDGRLLSESLQAQ